MRQLSIVRRSPIVAVVLSAVMAALVTVATYIIQVPVPTTTGYINVGDTMIFVGALVFGPLIGGIAGGIGSALADMWGGYWHFVPITLVVKGIEGLVAGFVSDGRRTWRDLLAVLLGGAIMILGYFIAETFLLGYGAEAALVEVPGNMFQVTAGGLVGIPVSYAVRRYTRSFR